MVNLNASLLKSCDIFPCPKFKTKYDLTTVFGDYLFQSTSWIKRFSVHFMSV